MPDSGFSNDPIDISSIPRLRDEDFVAVDPNYLKVRLIGHVVQTVFLVLPTIAVSALLQRYSSNPVLWSVLAMLAFLLLRTFLSALFTVVSVKNLGYLLREHDLSHRRGAIVKSVDTVPFIRVQHVRVAQGAIDRAFGLARLEVNSAGPNLYLAGLKLDDAERLRSIVVERAGQMHELA